MLMGKKKKEGNILRSSSLPFHHGKFEVAPKVMHFIFFILLRWPVTSEVDIGVQQ